MGEIFGWMLVLLVAALVLFLLFLFIKAAVKSAIRDIMGEEALKKLEEEKQKK